GRRRPRHALRRGRRQRARRPRRHLREGPLPGCRARGHLRDRRARAPSETDRTARTDPHRPVRPFLRWALVAAAAAALVTFPYWSAPWASRFATTIVRDALILAIFALSLDLLVGRAGMPSLGHAALFGVRENERRMRALGYDTARLRLSAFVLAGTIAGIAGALSAYSTRFVSAQDAGLGNSVRAFVTVLVGGAGTLGGPILGSALVSLIERVVPSLLPTDLRISDAILGIIFIAFVLFARQGMVGLGRFALLRVSRR